MDIDINTTMALPSGKQIGVVQNIGGRSFQDDRLMIADTPRPLTQADFAKVIEDTTHGINEILYPNDERKQLHGQDLLLGLLQDALSDEDDIMERSGTTLAAVQINPGLSATAACIGDSGIGLIIYDPKTNATRFRSLTTPHDLNNEDEKQRIKKLIADDPKENAWFDYPYLKKQGFRSLTLIETRAIAITRSLGNEYFHPFVIPTPEIKTFDLRAEFGLSGNEVLWISAESDGVSRARNDETRTSEVDQVISSLIKTTGDVRNIKPHQVAEQLAGIAQESFYRENSRVDNQTAIVVPLDINDTFSGCVAVADGNGKQGGEVARATAHVLSENLPSNP